MKKILFIALLITSLQAVGQEKEKVFVTNVEDLIINDLFGTYKTDGYYFYIVKSNAHLFEIRFEMNWYDDDLEKNVVLDQCNGGVDFSKGKLLLTWEPCNNENSYSEVQILSNDSIDFEFYIEEGVAYLNFLGTSPPHKVD